MMSSFTREPDSLSMNALSVALISPNAARRRSLVTAVSGPQASIRHQFPEYPDFDALSTLDEMKCDVVIVDLDSDTEQALDAVEAICSRSPNVTVMVYTGQQNPDRLVRSMRAGARELLTDPLEATTVTDALIRAASRRTEIRREKKTAGQLITFLGAKGGSGTTTIASNFAYSLAKESGKTVALVDLDLVLGDAALKLGITTEFSIADALQNSTRLDSDFVLKLLKRDDSGLAILAAPDDYRDLPVSDETISRILSILKFDFAYVIVDVGSRLMQFEGVIRDLAETVYLVSEVNIPALRNSHRLLNHFNMLMPGRLEVILNRVENRKLGLDDDTIARALSKTPKFKLPNDFASVRKAENTGVPLVNEDSPISAAIIDMARSTCGKVVVENKRKRFGLF